MHHCQIFLRAVLSLLLTLPLVVFTACESDEGGGGGGGPTDPEPSLVDFDGVVTSVDPDVDTLILDDNLRVRVDDDTEFDDEGDLLSVQEVRDALTRGETVRVEGSGEREATNVLRAVSLKAEIEGPTGDVRFSGRVVALVRANRRMTLQSAIRLTVDVPPSTEFDPSGDLQSFEEIADAFDDGEAIQVEGSGDLLADGSTRAREMRVILVD